MTELKCPSCNTSLDFLTVLKSSNPVSINCKGCESKIKVSPRYAIPIALIAFLIAFGIWFLLHINDVTLKRTLLILIVYGLAMEYLYFAGLKIGVIPSNLSNANESDISMNAMKWKHAYFFGVTRSPLKEAGLKQNLAESLIKMVGATSFLGTGALIEPKYMINQKGTTPWIAMYVSLLTHHKDVLENIYNNQTAILLPNEFLQDIFMSHINWPTNILEKYDIELNGYNVFILPFLVPNSTEINTTLKQSLKAPDGSVEIFYIDIFDENNPEGLLAKIEHELDFIKRNRPDIFPTH